MTDRDAGRREGLEPTDADLRPYGWAPGRYTFKCLVCGGPKHLLDETADKRCSICRSCAVAKWKAGSLAAAPTPEPVEGEAGKAVRLADRILDRPHADPDDDLAVLARQLLRMRERLAASQAAHAEMRARCEALEEALRPFVNGLLRQANDWSDDDRVLSGTGVTAGEVRRAAAALNPKSEEAGR